MSPEQKLAFKLANYGYELTPCQVVAWAMATVYHRGAPLDEALMLDVIRLQLTSTTHFGMLLAELDGTFPLMARLAT